MYFVLNYNEGYEVGVVMWDELYGRQRTYPLRNFGERQGDAKVFQLCDCPHLDLRTIQQLAKRYDSRVKYRRESARRFVREIQNDQTTNP